MDKRDFDQAEGFIDTWLRRLADYKWTTIIVAVVIAVVLVALLK